MTKLIALVLLYDGATTNESAVCKRAACVGDVRGLGKTNQSENERNEKKKRGGGGESQQVFS